MNAVQSPPDLLALLHFALVELIDRIHKADPKISQLRALTSVSTQLEQIRRSRAVTRGNHRVGVFGASKRGKSTLLNALLGCPLLPARAVPMTATEIELRHDETSVNDRYHLIDDRGELPSVATLASATSFLERVACRSGGDEQELGRVVVRGKFSGSRLLSGRLAGALVDTPGADGVLGTADKELASEGQRAIKAMQGLDCVLFCVRLDLLRNEDDGRLFASQCATLRPIVVATYLDQWDDEKQEPKARVSDWLSVSPDRVFCLDARAACEGGSDAVQALDAIVRAVESDLPNSSYAGDIQTVQRVLLAIGHLCEGFLATPDRKYRWPTLAWAALSHHVNSDTDARESIERIRSRFSRQTSETERLASVIGNASNPSSHLGAKSR